MAWRFACGVCFFRVARLCVWSVAFVVLNLDLGLDWSGMDEIKVFLMAYYCFVVDCGVCSEIDEVFFFVCVCVDVVL